MTTPHEQLIEVARGLVSDPGSNPEYERALVELVGYANGMSSDEFPDVAKKMGIGLATGMRYTFEQAAQVIYTTDEFGNILSVDVCTLDAPEIPQQVTHDMDYTVRPDAEERYERSSFVWEQADAKDWAFNEDDVRWNPI